MAFFERLLADPNFQAGMAGLSAARQNVPLGDALAQQQQMAMRQAAFDNELEELQWKRQERERLLGQREKLTNLFTPTTVESPLQGGETGPGAPMQATPFSQLDASGQLSALAEVMPAQFAQAQLEAAFRRPDTDLVQVMGPDGRPVFMRESEARGMQPYVKPTAPTQRYSIVADGMGGFMRVDKYTGEMTPARGISGGPAGTEEPAVGKMTEVQVKAFDAAERMTRELPEMQKLLEQGYMPQNVDALWSKNQGATMAPALKMLTSEQGQQFYGRGREILAAVLRKESGAAITAEEWNEMGPLWLPWPGDSEETVRIKMSRLESRLRSMQLQAGGGRNWLEYQEGQVGGTNTEPGSSEDNPIVIE